LVDPREVADRICLVREEIIRAGGVAVQLVAVTKSFPRDAIAAAVLGGCDAVGENYAQELLAKVEEGLPPVDVHFIGGLQSNKVKMLAPHVALWQSVDSMSVIHEIAKRAPGARVLLQVNTTGEATKGGITPSGITSFLELAVEVGLAVEGLMTIGPTDAGDSERQRSFTTLRRMVDELGLSVCSMGMSDDFVQAVECGSTMVRVGSRLFGARPT
jgi:hypothetical protein